LASGVHEKFTSREIWAQLTKGPQRGDGGLWPGSLTIHDRFERIVYFAAGGLSCHG
jgi:hypothetical protein